jgi:hypothetical protein
MKIGDNTVTMSKRDFVHEHKRLVHVLQARQHKDLAAEAKDQAGELKEVESS